MPLHVSSTSAHRQEVLYSLWYRYTETSEWSKFTKIIKIQFYKHFTIILIKLYFNNFNYRIFR